MTTLLRSRRERGEDPMMRDIRETVEAEVGKTLNKRIAPALMKTEIVGNFMETLLAYGEHVLEQERPEAQILGGMPRWRRQEVLRTDSRTQRDSASAMTLKLCGAFCLLTVLLILMVIFGSAFYMLVSYFTPTSAIP